MSNSVTLTATEVTVLARLLRMAGDEFSHHGCYEFNLIRDGGLAPGEAQEFMTRLQVENPDQPPELYDYETLDESALFRHFQSKLERALLKTPESEVVASGSGITISAVRLSAADRAALNTGGAWPPLDYDAVPRGLKS
jgi:hypothetical protein